MYIITIDGHTAHGGNTERMTALEPVLAMAADAAGTLSMTLPHTNQCYGNLVHGKSVVRVFKDTELIWSGRVISTSIDFKKMMDVTAEGIFAFFNDSVFRTASYSGDITELIQYVIENHNSQVDAFKQFFMGSVTVSPQPGIEPLGQNNAYRNSRAVLDDIRQKSGGHFAAYEMNGLNYLDYIPDFEGISNQRINFGKNLLNVAYGVSGGLRKTVIIPLGKTVGDTKQRLTISSVNQGKDYLIHAEAAVRYGKIATGIVYDDVTDPAELKARGNADLASLAYPAPSIVATAVDLSLIDQSIDTFHVGDLVHVTSPPHAIEEDLQVTAIRLDLAKPDKSEITLGTPENSFVERSI